MDEKKFKETEAKYRDLKEKHSNNEISTEQMKEELKRLMIQDEDGNYWMLGGKTGKWYKHDGTQWQEGDPFEEIAAAVEVLTEPMGEEESLAAGESVSTGEEVYPLREEESVSSEGERFPSDETEIISSEGDIYPSDENDAVSPGEELYPGVESESVPSEGEPYPSDEREMVSYEEESYPVVENEPVPSAGEFYPADEKEPVSSEGDFYPSDETEARSDAGEDEDGVLLLDTKKFAKPTEEDEGEKEEAKKGEEKYEGYDEKAFVVDIGAGDKVDTGDYIRCSVCESDNPVTSETCIFCGANLKETEPKGIDIEGIAKSKTKKRIKIKEKKKKKEKVEPGEEEELLIKSIKYTSLIFFLGGLGLFFGVLLGAAFGVFKPFLLKWSYDLPLMLQEVRGGAAGGLIFAAVGGIGGFIISAILSVILSAIYNFIAFIFGGIRFKVKR